MKRAYYAALIVMIAMMAVTCSPAGADQLPISAPQHFGVKHYIGDNFNFTVSIPDDLRGIIDGYDPKLVLVVKIQVDYMMDGIGWHYTPDWDQAKMGLPNTIGVAYIRNESYISQNRTSLSSMFPADAGLLQSVKNSGWGFPDKAISFRARFVTSLDRNQTYIYSDWSEVFVYSKDVVEDPDKLINYPPILTGATVEKNTAGAPFLKVRTGRIPDDVQELNALTGSGMQTETWLRRAGDKDFKLVHSSFLTNEYILIDADDYFDKAKLSYEAEGYEIKIRYVLNNLSKYPQAGRSDTIYSPFSNVYSQNMPAWAGASKWAATELGEADQIGLIPEILKGADLTKPITREEFAELAVLLYEKTMGISSSPMEPNPFTDTTNPQILKAANIGITKGTSPTEFSPYVLINREQCATMLFRAMKAMEPDADYSIDGVKDFTDQDRISAFAFEATKYMSKIGIILGDSSGRFMPRAVTSAEQAAKYGMATREQAIVMALRIYKK